MLASVRWNFSLACDDSLSTLEAKVRHLRKSMDLHAAQRGRRLTSASASRWMRRPPSQRHPP
eukprot:12586437-Prorocentrum_lima.AAC.1